MCIITPELYIATTDDARDFLRAHGLDDYQIDEFSTVLHSENFLDLEYEHECLKHEFKSYEASLDAAQGVLNGLLVLCSEKMTTERTKAGREAYRAVYDHVFRSEAI